MARNLLLNDKIEIEYKLAKYMLVCSHGFGVDRHSNGLFTDIVHSLPVGWGYVLFDYNVRDGNKTRLTIFSEQQARLAAVLNWVHTQQDVQSVSLLAHSMGCIVAALLQPINLQKVILLAPPTVIGEATRQYFTTKSGTSREGDYWIVPRRDSSISIIPEMLFDEFERTDALQALCDLANQQPYSLIVAGADEVLSGADYTSLKNAPQITYYELPSANHNFENDSRQALLTIVSKLLV